LTEENSQSPFRRLETRGALANQGKTTQLPVHLIDKIYKLNRASLTMSEELGREPTDEELSEEVGISRRSFLS
jgi:DNA-directed RNA polymerase sigma subunit (sigma70/sigma32)